MGSVESVETSSDKTKERSRDDFSIWFRPGVSAVVFMILPAMILLNQNFGKIMAGKIMKTKALTCYDQLVITTKRGSDCVSARKISRNALAQWHLLYESGSGAGVFGLRFLNGLDFGRRG